MTGVLIPFVPEAIKQAPTRYRCGDIAHMATSGISAIHSLHFWYHVWSLHIHCDTEVKKKLGKLTDYSYINQAIPQPHQSTEVKRMRFLHFLQNTLFSTHSSLHKLRTRLILCPLFLFYPLASYHLIVKAFISVSKYNHFLKQIIRTCLNLDFV